MTDSRLHLRLASLALFGLATACASDPPPVKDPFPGVARRAAADEGAPPAAAAPAAPAVPAAPRPPPDVANLDPIAYASRFGKGGCEAAARSIIPTSREKAWAVLKACVDRGTFTALAHLVDGTWDKDLQTRPDAALLIAKLVAQRGGDVDGDLASLRKRKVPLFSLGPAASYPDVYKGRLILCRAKVGDLRTEKGKTTVKLVEYALGAETRYVAGDVRTRRSGSARVEGSGEWRTSSGSGRGRGEASGSSEVTWSTERKRNDNFATETGVEALGRLTRADPFFEPGRQFVILARFDDVRELPGDNEEDPEKMAVVSILGYFEPAAAIVE